MVEKLASMDQDQGGPLSCGDHFRGDDGFPECRGRCQHAALMRKKGCDGGILLRSQFPEELGVDWLPLLPFVAQLDDNTHITEDAPQVVQASSR